MAPPTSQITSNVSAAKPLLVLANPLAPAAPADLLATDAPAHMTATNVSACPPSVPAGPAIDPPTSPDHKLACPPERPEDHESASGDGLATHPQVLPHDPLALGAAMDKFTLADAAGLCLPLPATPNLPAQGPSVLDSVPQNPAPVSAHHLSTLPVAEPSTPDLPAPPVRDPLDTPTGNSLAANTIPLWQRIGSPGVATGSTSGRHCYIIRPDGRIIEQPYKIRPGSPAFKAFITDTLGPETAHDDPRHRHGFGQAKLVTYYSILPSANTHLPVNTAANEAFNSSNSEANKRHRLKEGPMLFRGPVILHSNHPLPLP